MDTISEKRRSWNMSRIRSRDTAPETAVRRLVLEMGRRYRRHARELPGCPDLVFARDRKLIFVHGCFWHQHAGCTVARMPNSRLDYWLPKLEGNRRRDLRNARKLKRAGWAVLTIRECELVNIERVAHRLREFLDVGGRKTSARASAVRSHKH